MSPMEMVPFRSTTTNPGAETGTKLDGRWVRASELRIGNESCYYDNIIPLCPYYASRPSGGAAGGDMEIRNVAVFGAGQMGGGIAQVLAQNGHAVTLVHIEARLVG